MSKMRKLFKTKKSTSSEGQPEWTKHDEKLAQAVEKSDLEKIKELMSKKGAIATKLDPQGNTCLHRAAVEGKIEVIKILLQHKADPNALDQEGRNALHCAVRSGHYNVAEKLVEAQTDLTAVDRHKLSTLHHACMSGNVDCVRLLLNNRAPVYLQDEDGRPPLFYAARMNHVPICKELIETDCNLNTVDYQRKTAVIMAAEEGKTDVVEFLVSKGANVHLTDSASHDAMYYARTNGHKAIVDILAAVPFDGVEADQEQGTRARDESSSSVSGEDDDEMRSADVSHVSAVDVHAMDVDQAVVPLHEDYVDATRGAVNGHAGDVQTPPYRETDDGHFILEEETHVTYEEVEHTQAAPPKVAAPPYPPPSPPSPSPSPPSSPTPPEYEVPANLPSSDLGIDVEVPVQRPPSDSDEEFTLAQLPPPPPVPQEQGDLQMKLNEALEENKQLRERIEALEAELNRLRDPRLQALGELLKPMETQLTQSLEREKEDLLRQLEEEQNKNSSLEEEIKQLREQLDTRPEADRSDLDYKELAEALQSQIEKLEDENSTLKERLMEQERSLTPLSALKPSLSEKELRDLANYQDLQEAHDKEIKYFMNKFEKMDAEKDALARKITDNDQLEAKIDKLQQDINRLIENPDSYDDESFDQLQKDIAVVQREIPTSAPPPEKSATDEFLGIKNKALIKANMELKKENAILADQVDSINDVIAHAQALKDENDSLRESYEALKGEIDVNERAVARDKEDLMKWFKELEEENSNLKDKNKELAKQLDILEIKLNEMASMSNVDEISALQVENTHLKQDIKGLNQSSEKQAQDNNKQLQEIAKLTALLGLLQEGNNDIDDLEKRRKELNTILSELDEEIGEKELLVKNYRKLLEDNQSLNREVSLVKEKLEKRNEDLEEQLQESSDSNKNFREKIVELERRLEELDRDDSGFDTLREDIPAVNAAVLENELKESKGKIENLEQHLKDLTNEKVNKDKDLKEAKTKLAELLVANAVLSAKEHEMQQAAPKVNAPPVEDIIVIQEPVRQLESQPPPLPQSLPPTDGDDDDDKANVEKLLSENQALQENNQKLDSDMKSMEEILRVKENALQRAHSENAAMHQVAQEKANELESALRDIDQLKQSLADKETLIPIVEEQIVVHDSAGALQSKPPPIPSRPPPDSDNMTDLHIGDELRKLMQENEDLQEELKTLEDRLGKERESFKDSQSQHALEKQDQEDEISALQRTIEELKVYLQKNMEGAEDDPELLKLKMDEVFLPKTTPEYLKSHDNIGKETMEEQRKDAESLKAEIGEVRDSFADSKNSLIEDNIKLKEENKRLHREIDNIQRNTDSISTLMDLENENKMLKEENLKLREELEQLRIHAKREHDRLMEEIETWKNEIELIRDGNKEKLYAENAKLRAALEELKAQLEEMGGDNVVLVKAEELKELREELDRLRSRPATPVEELPDPLMEVIKELEADKEHLALQVAKLQEADKDTVKKEEVVEVKQDNKALEEKLKGVEEAVQENNELRQEKEKLCNELSAVKEIVESLKKAADDNENLQKEKKDLLNETEMLEKEVFTLKAENEECDSLRNENKSLAQTKADLESEVSRLSEVEKDNEKLKAEAADVLEKDCKIKEELEQSKHHCKALEQEQENKEKLLAAQALQLATLNKLAQENEELKTEAQALMNENEEMLERFEDLKQRSHEREKQLHQENEQLMEQAESLQVEVEDQKAAAVHAEVEKNRILESNKLLVDDITDLEETLADNEKRIADLEKTKNDLSQEVVELASIPKFTTELQCQMKDLEQELEQMKDKAALLNEEKNLAEERCLLLTEDITRLEEVPKVTPEMEQERKDLEEQLEKLQDSHAVLEHKAENAESNCASLKVDLEKLEAVPKVTPQMEQERRDLEDNLLKVNEDLKKLAEKVQELDKVKAENGILKKELSELEKVPKYTPELQKRHEDEIAELQRDIDDLRDKMEEYDALVQDNKDLAQELQRAQRIPKLTPEIEAEIRDLRKQVADFDGTAKSLEKAKQELSDTQQELAQQKSVPKLTPEIEEQLQTLNADNKQLQQQIQSLDQLLKESDEFNEEEKERLAKENEAIASENNDLCAKIDKIEEELTNTRNEAEQQKQEINNLRNQPKPEPIVIVKEETRVVHSVPPSDDDTDLAAQNKDLQSAVERLEEQLNNSKKKSEEQEEEIEQLKKRPISEPVIIVKDEVRPVESAPPLQPDLDDDLEKTNRQLKDALEQVLKEKNEKAALVDDLKKKCEGQEKEIELLKEIPVKEEVILPEFKPVQRPQLALEEPIVIVKDDSGVVQSAPPSDSPATDSDLAALNKDLLFAAERLGEKLNDRKKESEEQEDEIEQLKKRPISEPDIIAEDKAWSVESAPPARPDLNEDLEKTNRQLKEALDQVMKENNEKAALVDDLKKKCEGQEQEIELLKEIPVKEEIIVVESKPPQSAPPTRPDYDEDLEMTNRQLKEALDQVLKEKDEKALLVDDLKKKCEGQEKEIELLKEIPVREEIIVVESKPVQSAPPTEGLSEREQQLYDDKRQLENELAALKAAKPEHRDKSDETDNEIQKMRDENNRLKNNLEAMEKVLEENLQKKPDDEVEDIKRQNKNLNKDVEDLSAKLDESVPIERLRELKSGAKALQDENDNLSSIKDDLLAVNDELKNELEALESRLDAIGHEPSRDNAEEDELRAKNKELVSQLKDLQDRVKELELELEKALKDGDEKVQQVRGDMLADIEKLVEENKPDRGDLDERERQLQHEKDLLQMQVREITAERLDNLAQINGLKKVIDDLGNELTDAKVEKQKLKAENNAFRQNAFFDERPTDDDLVSRLRLENKKLQDFLCMLESRLDKNKTPSSSKAGSGANTPRAGTPVLSPHFGALDLQHQVEDLQRQLQEAEARHKEIVATYRSHLLGAVQGHIDPEVKNALLHIVKLREISSQFER